MCVMMKCMNCLQVYRNKGMSKYHDLNGLIDNITNILAASQSFMRNKHVHVHVHNVMYMTVFGLHCYLCNYAG